MGSNKYPKKTRNRASERKIGRKKESKKKQRERYAFALLCSAFYGFEFLSFI